LTWKKQKYKKTLTNPCNLLKKTKKYFSNNSFSFCQAIFKVDESKKAVDMNRLILFLNNNLQ